MATTPSPATMQSTFAMFETTLATIANFGARHASPQASQRVKIARWPLKRNAVDSSSVGSHQIHPAHQPRGDEAQRERGQPEDAEQAEPGAHQRPRDARPLRHLLHDHLPQAKLGEERRKGRDAQSRGKPAVFRNAQRPGQQRADDEAQGKARTPARRRATTGSCAVLPGRADAFSKATSAPPDVSAISMRNLGAMNSCRDVQSPIK